MKFKEFLFTGFYSGYIPKAPGTAGTVVGVALYWILYLIFGAEYIIPANLILVLVMLYPSIKLGDAGETFYGTKDPQAVVLDEMMGFWITMLFVPFSWTMVLLGFLLFRIMDILKPYPANTLQNLKGGLGIMIDDYIAGVYACLVLHGIRYGAPMLGFNL